MKQSSKHILGALALGALAASSNTALAADKELLDILLKNLSITKAQYDTLLAKSEVDEKSTSKLLKNMAWAGKIKVKGDLRLRQEFIDDSGGAGDDRSRIRARLGVYADVTDNLKAGIRMASGGSATSTNRTLSGAFANSGVFFDLAYMNWEVTDGLELIGGKFKKPWETVSGGLIWDGDTNPEGGAIRYTTKMGDAKLIASAGHLVLDDVGNLSYSQDQRVRFAQLATRFKAGSAKAKLGASVFAWSPNSQTLALTTGGGNNSTSFTITDLFGEVKFKAPLPIKVYIQYVKNSDANGANSDQDTAWLIGVGGKFDHKWKASVDYRDTELNAVNGAFNDSDFAGGRTDSKGYRMKVGYKIDKNLSVGATYFNTETGNLNGNRNIDILQLDLKAKF